jgi:hypothetical protein
MMIVVSVSAPYAMRDTNRDPGCNGGTSHVSARRMTAIAIVGWVRV